MYGMMVELNMLSHYFFSGKMAGALPCHLSRERIFSYRVVPLPTGTKQTKERKNKGTKTADHNMSAHASSGETVKVSIVCRQLHSRVR
jgi:hypothetical protein